MEDSLRVQSREALLILKFGGVEEKAYGFQMINSASSPILFLFNTLYRIYLRLSPSYIITLPAGITPKSHTHTRNMSAGLHVTEHQRVLFFGIFSAVSANAQPRLRNRPCNRKRDYQRTT